jgi:hypothetical protein
MLLRVVLCSRPQGLRPQMSWRCSKTPLHEASNEAVIRAGLLRLAVGPARGDLACGSSFVDLRGGWVLDLWWDFTLIWVPLIVVLDSSPRTCGGIGTLLQRLHVGYAICQGLAQSLQRPWLVFWLLFSEGCVRAHPSSVAPEPVEE